MTNVARTFHCEERVPVADRIVTRGAGTIRTGGVDHDAQLSDRLRRLERSAGGRLVRDIGDVHLSCSPGRLDLVPDSLDLTLCARDQNHLRASRREGYRAAPSEAAPRVSHVSDASVERPGAVARFTHRAVWLSRSRRIVAVRACPAKFSAVEIASTAGATRRVPSSVRR